MTLKSVFESYSSDNFATLTKEIGFRKIIP